MVDFAEIPDEIIDAIPEALTPDKDDEPKPSNVVYLAEMTAAVTERLMAGHAEMMKNRVEQFKPSEVIEALWKGQDGDAELFVKLFKDHYAYDKAGGCWYYWNDHYWRKDVLDQCLADVSKVIELYNKEKAKIPQLKEKAIEKGDKDLFNQYELLEKRITRWISLLHTLKHKQHVIHLASSGVDSLAIPGQEWDSNPMLLGVRNGCIDLKTGEFKPGNPRDYIKTVAPTEWTDINAVPQTWIDCLHMIFGGSNKMVEYIQRLCGYGITGLTTENIYPILWGEHGQNGKSTLLETIKDVIGDGLACKLSSDFLMQRGIQKSSNGPDAELFSLRGARIAWCSETNKGERLNVNKIKELSGADTISARPPYGKEQIHFKPSHLIFILTNRRPQMPADDNALWLRTHLIPFAYSFVNNPKKPYERKKDPNLAEKLKKEHSAILAWLIRGCLKWQREGLNPPEELIAATEEYRVSEDIFQTFLDETVYKDSTLFVERSKLFDAYRLWCTDNEYKRMNKKHFYEELKRKFGEPVQLSEYNRARGYKGYALIPRS